LGEEIVGERVRRAVELLYVLFEFAALAALVAATSASIYEFFHVLVSSGFNYTIVLEKILLIFVFIDLTRTLVASIVAGRFRMDILLEAITIALARDLILSIAVESQNINPLKIATLGALLAVAVLLWALAKKIESLRLDKIIEA